MLRVFFNSFKNNGIYCKKIKNSYIFKYNFSNGFLDSIYIDENEDIEDDLLYLLPLNKNKENMENIGSENKKNENKKNENKKDENK